MILQVDDLTKGQIFTIMSWKRKNMFPNNGQFPEEMVAILSGGNDGWGMGEVFRVLAVSLPFVSVECLSLADMKGKSFPLDTRKVELMVLSEEYVESLITKDPVISNSATEKLKELFKDSGISVYSVNVPPSKEDQEETNES